jgi:hypothetical protein
MRFFTAPFEFSPADGTASPSTTGAFAVLVVALALAPPLGMPPRMLRHPTGRAMNRWAALNRWATVPTTRPIPKIEKIGAGSPGPTNSAPNDREFIEIACRRIRLTTATRRNGRLGP